MKKASKWLAIMLAIVMLASVGLVGCSSSNDDEPKEDTTQPADNTGDQAKEPVKEPQELHMMLGAEPPAMDAQITTDSESFIVINAVQEGLVRVGPEGIAPGMAESWDITNEGKTYTFNLRKDAKWSNGSPITAEDFMDGWERAINAHNASQYASMLTDYVVGAADYYNYTNYEVLKDMYENNRDSYDEAYKEEDGTVPTPDVVAFGEAVENPQPVALDSVGFSAKDEYTLEVNIIKPTPWFLELTAFATYMPLEKSFYEQQGETYATEVDKMLYNGPWVISEWAHEAKVVLERNEAYWDNENVSLDKITLDIVKDQGTALDLYEAGDVDRSGLARENVPLYKDDPNFGTFGEQVHFYLVFNTTKKPFNNPKVRKAISFALDRQAYVDTTLNNGSVPGDGLVPEDFMAYAGASQTFREASRAKYGGKLFEDGKPEEAKKMLEEGLAEEGMKLEDFTFEFLSGDTEGARKSSEFLKSMWKQTLGVDVDIPGVPFAERLKRSRAQQFDIVLSGWGPDYNDPLTWLFLFEKDGDYNDGKYDNPRYNELVQLAREELDQDKRLDYFLEAEKILVQDDHAIAPIYYRNLAFLMRPYVKGFMEKVFGAQWEFKWVYIEGK